MSKSSFCAGATSLPMIRYHGREHRGKVYPHGVDKALIRLHDGVRCFYGDEFGYKSDYHGIDVELAAGSILKLGTKSVSTLYPNRPNISYSRDV